MQHSNTKTTVLLAFIACTLTWSFTFNKASASTVTIIEDTWINWPGYTSSLGDELGSPKLDKMRITVGDNHVLEKVELLWRPNSGTYTRIRFDSLFINSYDIVTTNNDWDDWDYLVHDGGNEHTWTGGTVNDVVNGTIPGDGLWSLLPDYQYTTAKTSNLRQDNPNGIDANYLENQQDFSLNITWDSSNGILTYDLAAFGITAENGLFVAYAPYCANDLIGGSVNPVPVPATVWLFASGLVGLISFHRRIPKSI